MTQNNDWDLVVVGGGTSGSIVARRAVDAGWRTLLIEAGGSNRTDAIQDVGKLNTLWHSSMDWDYHTVPQPHAASRRLHLPRGRVLGGSHSLNAAIWVRGAASDYDGWAEQGAEGWSWAEVEPIFRRIERRLGTEDPRRGRSGLLPITDNEPLHPVQRAIVDAAVQAGLPVNRDYNVGDQEGVSIQQVTIEHADRVTTWDAYAQPAVDDARLVVRTGTLVHRVTFEHARATGVRLDSGEVITARNVVLSAGALGSAELLLRSGVGPAGHLGRLGIPVIADLPVGDNLHDHYLVPVVFSTAREIAPPEPHRSATQTHWFWRSDPALEVPDTQPICFSVPMLEPGMDPLPWGFSLMAGIVTTRSRGTLRLAGPDRRDGVLIDPHVLEDERDVAAMLASVKQCLDVGAQPALSGRWGARPHAPGAGLSDEELVGYIRGRVVTYHHQVGTCRMGTDSHAVVDPQLRVRGVAGLRVADASVMPTITTGNTNAPSAMIGERAASLLLA